MYVSSHLPFWLKEIDGLACRGRRNGYPGSTQCRPAVGRRSVVSTAAHAPAQYGQEPMFVCKP